MRNAELTSPFQANCMLRYLNDFRDVGLEVRDECKTVFQDIVRDHEAEARHNSGE